MCWEVRLKKAKEDSLTRSLECKPSFESLRRPVQTGTGKFETISGRQSYGHGIAKVRFCQMEHRITTSTEDMDTDWQQTFLIKC